ncbi:unnamed protein product [Aphanomyces euteiches]
MASLVVAMLWRVFVTVTLACMGVQGALAPIVVRGNRLYNSQTGERFFIRGITYDYDVSDKNYAASKSIIETNLKSMKGTFNTFRLYNANPERSYDQFMTHMASLGVYVMISASPANLDYYKPYQFATITKAWGPDGTAVVTNGVAQSQKDQTKTCYPSLLLEYGKKLIKDFAKYDNTLAFVIANEIMQEDLTAAACVKAYASDLKNWMRVNSKYLRLIPLAYAGADAPPMSKTKNAEDYTVVKIMGLLCGDKMVNGVSQSSIDIYLINEYRWCNVPGTFVVYENFVKMAKGVPIVMALGEFGCNTQMPRQWTMVPYLFSDSAASKGFTDSFSGGCAYTFGEASVSDDRFPMFKGGSKEIEGLPGTSPTVDYTNLAAQYKAVPSATEKGNFTKDTICKWSPPEPTPGTNPVFLATKTWWPACTDPNIKLETATKWLTNSRQGAVCNSNGGMCEVTIETANPTTEESICGAPIAVPSGGGTCKTNEDCGTHGQCVSGSDGKFNCVCIGCWSGNSCSIYSADLCNKLSNNPAAPKIIFTIVGAFLGLMLLVFGGIGVAASKKAGELRRAEHGSRASHNIDKGIPKLFLYSTSDQIMPPHHVERAIAAAKDLKTPVVQVVNFETFTHVAHLAKAPVLYLKSVQTFAYITLNALRDYIKLRLASLTSTNGSKK